MSALFGFTGPRDERLCQRLARALAHRVGGCRPMVLASHESTVAGGGSSAHAASADGVSVVLAGELTNAAELIAAAPPAGDSELGSALLTLYREEGLRCLGRLRGAWVLAILDRDTLHLARDGVGVRTLYWARVGARVVFGNEPKAIWSLPDFARRVAPAGIARYLAFSFQPGAPTMLQGLSELCPGQCLSFVGGGEPRAHDHFNPFALSRPGTLAARSDAEWVEAFRAEHARAVAERLPADGPVAATLSGGIDSSVVVAELARQSPRRVRTYALHFGADYPHELDYARAVAEQAGTEHHEVHIRPRDFLPRLRRILWHLDDPIGDPVTVPNFEIAAHISHDTRHVFNGEGGDPCFGGPKNLTMMLHHWYGGIARSPGFRERAYLASYRRAYEEIDHLLAPEWRAQVDPARDLESVLTPFLEADVPTGMLDKLMAINLRLKGAHLILPKVERMQAAAGVVPLAPLFDERVVQLSFAMPPTLKVARGVEKIALKEAYRDAVPAEVIARPKSGMRVPVHYWFQGELRSYARKVLGRRELRRVGIFDPDRVRQYLRYDIEEGNGRYGLRLWMLLSFEIWRRIVVEGEAV